MNPLKLKVCGMKDPDNMIGLQQLHPDFMGMIFYPKSPRYVNGLNPSHIPEDIQKVGVFVNEEAQQIIRTVVTYQLHYVQLHGDEPLDLIKKLKDQDIRIIKVFRITDTLPGDIATYVPFVDHFLFDTQTKQYGGSGQRFDWSILKNYTEDIPYLLSGGIETKDIETIKAMQLPGLAGIDINSKFETAPGYKDLEKIEALTRIIRGARPGGLFTENITP